MSVRDVYQVMNDFQEIFKDAKARKDLEEGIGTFKRSDGALGASEFSIALTMASNNFSPQEAKELFGLLDVTSSGSITSEELWQFLGPPQAFETQESELQKIPAGIGSNPDVPTSSAAKDAGPSQATKESGSQGAEATNAKDLGAKGAEDPKAKEAEGAEVSKASGAEESKVNGVEEPKTQGAKEPSVQGAEQSKAEGAQEPKVKGVDGAEQSKPQRVEETTAKGAGEPEAKGVEGTRAQDIGEPVSKDAEALKAQRAEELKTGEPKANVAGEPKAVVVTTAEEPSARADKGAEEAKSQGAEEPKAKKSMEPTAKGAEEPRVTGAEQPGTLSRRTSSGISRTPSNPQDAGLVIQTLTSLLKAKGTSMAKVLTDFDTNNNGYISSREFCKNVGRLEGLEMTQSAISNLYRHMKENAQESLDEGGNISVLSIASFFQEIPGAKEQEPEVARNHPQAASEALLQPSAPQPNPPQQSPAPQENVSTPGASATGSSAHNPSAAGSSAPDPSAPSTSDSEALSSKPEEASAQKPEATGGKSTAETQNPKPPLAKQGSMKRVATAAEADKSIAAVKEALTKKGADLVKTLKEMDANGDGMISSREFCKAVGRMDAIDITQSEAAALYSYMKENRESGSEGESISIPEFISYFKVEEDSKGQGQDRVKSESLKKELGVPEGPPLLQRDSSSQQSFRRAASSSDAVQSFEAIQSVIAAKGSDLITVLKEMDANGDGLVSSREFCKAVGRIENLAISQAEAANLYNHWKEAKPSSQGGASFTIDELMELFKEPPKIKEVRKEDDAVSTQIPPMLSQDSRKGLGSSSRSLGRTSSASDASRSISELQSIVASKGQDVIALLKEMDANGDGMISTREFCKAIGKMETSLSQSEASNLYRYWLEHRPKQDRGDASLTLEELTQLFSKKIEAEVSEVSEHVAKARAGMGNGSSFSASALAAELEKQEKGTVRATTPQMIDNVRTALRIRGVSVVSELQAMEKEFEAGVVTLNHFRVALVNLQSGLNQAEIEKLFRDLAGPVAKHLSYGPIFEAFVDQDRLDLNDLAQLLTLGTTQRVFAAQRVFALVGGASTHNKKEQDRIGSADGVFTGLLKVMLENPTDVDGINAIMTLAELAYEHIANAKKIVDFPGAIKCAADHLFSPTVVRGYAVRRMCARLICNCATAKAEEKENGGKKATAKGTAQAKKQGAISFSVPSPVEVKIAQISSTAMKAAASVLGEAPPRPNRPRSPQKQGPRHPSFQKVNSHHLKTADHGQRPRSPKKKVDKGPLLQPSKPDPSQRQILSQLGRREDKQSHLIREIMQGNATAQNAAGRLRLGSKDSEAKLQSSARPEWLIDSLKSLSGKAQRQAHDLLRPSDDDSRAAGFPGTVPSGNHICKHCWTKPRTRQPGDKASRPWSARDIMKFHSHHLSSCTPGNSID